MMKATRIILFTISLMTALSACNDVDELLTFKISDETTFQVEGNTLLDLPVNIATPDVTTNSSQKFENNNTKSDLVKDIRLDELRLSITSPTGMNFNFLKSIHLYISTTSSNEILLAHLENVPDNVTAIALETTEEKLDTYVKASSYKLRTTIVTDGALSQDVDVKVNLTFRVTAAPL